jgi:two-component system nitrogen regulation response regulator GlnG
MPGLLNQKLKTEDVRLLGTTSIFDIVRFVRELLSRNSRDVYYQTQAVVDRLVLKEVMEHAKGNQVEAAEILGISRNTLRARLRVCGLVVEKQINDAAG